MVATLRDAREAQVARQGTFAAAMGHARSNWGLFHPRRQGALACLLTLALTGPAQAATEAPEAAPQVHVQAGIALGLEMLPRIAAGVDWTPPFGLYLGFDFQNLVFPPFPYGGAQLAAGYGTSPDRAGFGYRAALAAVFGWASSNGDGYEANYSRGGVGLRLEGWYRFVPAARLALSLRPAVTWPLARSGYNPNDDDPDPWSLATDIELAYDGWYSKHCGLKVGLTFSVYRGPEAWAAFPWPAPNVLAQFRW